MISKIVSNEDNNTFEKKEKAHYFDISDNKYTENQRLKVLLATSALPVIFPKQRIGKVRYEDGGTADNVPVKPLHDIEKCELIIVVHLNDTFGTHDIIVDKDRFNDSTVIEIWPKQSQGGLRGTLDFNKKNAKRRIDEGYYENIAYFRVLAESLKNGYIPDNISYDNLLIELNKNIDRFKTDNEDRLITHTLIFTRDIISDVIGDLNNIRNELRYHQYDIELNRYMMVCNRKCDNNGKLYTSLTNCEKILNIVYDLYEIVGSNNMIDSIELEIITENVGLPLEMSMNDLVDHLKGDMVLWLENIVLSYECKDVSIYTKIICEMRNDENCYTYNFNTMVKTVDIISGILLDVQNIELFRKEKRSIKKNADKSIFKEDTVFAKAKIRELYSKNHCNNIFSQSDAVSPECLDYIKKLCIQFASEHEFNPKDNHGIIKDSRIVKWLEINQKSDIYLVHLDSLKDRKRGFVIDSEGIHSFYKPSARVDITFMELANIIEFKNHKSKNAVDNAMHRSRIKGINNNSEEKEILPKKHVHSADIIPFLESLRNACWVDMYL